MMASEAYGCDDDERRDANHRSHLSSNIPLFMNREGQQFRDPIGAEATSILENMGANSGLVYDTFPNPPFESHRGNLFNNCFQGQEAAAYEKESREGGALDVSANGNTPFNGGNFTFHPPAAHQQQTIPRELQMNAAGGSNTLNLHQQVFQNNVGLHGQYQNQGMMESSDQLHTIAVQCCRDPHGTTNNVMGQVALQVGGDVPIAPPGVVLEPATNSQTTLGRDDWEHVASLLIEKPESSVSLKEWVELERQRSSQDEKASLVRKLSVAYGIAKLLESSSIGHERCSIDNFAIQESFEEFRWVVGGIKMLTPRHQVILESTLFLRDFEEMVSDESMKGREVKVTFLDDGSTSSKQTGECDVRDEMQLCYVLGELLHYLFLGDNLQNTCQSQEEACNTNGSEDDLGGDAVVLQPSKKQTREMSFSNCSINLGSTAGTNRLGQCGENVPTKRRLLVDYGCPPSISQLVEDLLSCGDNLFRSDSAFKSLSDASNDIHLLLEEPSIFFERTIESRQGKHLLTASNEIRLFGRAAEITKVMDVYRRVATGKSENVIVEGLSG
jgi:hypothetical protein